MRKCVYIPAAERSQLIQPLVPARTRQENGRANSQKQLYSTESQNGTAAAAFRRVDKARAIDRIGEQAAVRSRERSVGSQERRIGEGKREEKKIKNRNKFRGGVHAI